MRYRREEKKGVGTAPHPASYPMGMVGDIEDIPDLEMWEDRL
jgi:hypothetical protein